MDGGQVELAAGLDQRLAMAATGMPAPDGQQAGAGHRAERDRDLQLRVVVAAGPLEGVRPAVVEHVFAVAVGFRVHRRDGDDLARAVAQRRRAAAASRCGRWPSRCPPWRRGRRG